MRKRMRHIFTIQKKLTGGVMGHGAGWVDLPENATVYGDLWTVKGQERIDSQAAGAEITHRVRLFYHPEIDTSTRLVFEGRNFDIVFDNNRDALNREIIADVIERV